MSEIKLVNINDERFWNVLFDEACVEGKQAERIQTELEKIAVGEKEITRKPMERIVNRIEEFAECKSCEETGLSESFYYGQGCKACMWKKVIDIIRAGGKET